MTIRIVNKIKILSNCLIGNLLIIPYRLFGVCGCPIIKNKERESDNLQITVSLTSYGRRVEKTVFYTIISLLKQKRQPNRIILWLDNKWNLDNIPSKLKRLVDCGVEIRFCEDILSYKKLIPTLSIAPDDIVITVDDDVYYSNNLIDSLYFGYLSNPDCIQCTQALNVGIDKDYEITPYKRWEKVTNPIIGDLLLPIGEGGVLYPPKSLYKDVSNYELFSKLCPNADDLWFWVMAKLNNRKHALVTASKFYYSFDALYQLIHKGSALTHTNKKEDKNDIQMKAILSYYNVLPLSLLQNQ